MRKMTRHDVHWFFEQKDGLGRWHTVADAALHSLQSDLRAAAVESLNLQWQFVRGQVERYNGWAGERRHSAERWPVGVSAPAARFLASYIDRRDGILAYNAAPQHAEDIPLTVPNLSFGVVGPCEGLALSWKDPVALARFTARVDAAKDLLGLLALPAPTGWHDRTGTAAVGGARLAGHVVLGIVATAHGLLPACVDTTRLLFAVEA